MKKNEPKLSHLDSAGKMRMVDVGDKSITRREAVAEARVVMSRATLDLVTAGGLPKGDVLAAARVAGILAAKQTSALVPLTHPLQLDFVGVDFESDPQVSAIRVTATVRCAGRTGAEIEAMTACAVAALTIYDMCKSAEHGIEIERIRLLRKSGGKSGDYVTP